MARAAGFFFGVRIILMVLAVRLFYLDPQTGMIITLLLNFLFLAAIRLTSSTDASRTSVVLQRTPVRWTLTFIALSCASLMWTSAVSLLAAAIFWGAMAADWLIVFLLVTQKNKNDQIATFLRGFVYGACVVSLVAWLLPSQSDLRLGDEELLGPNQIGYLCAMALFFAQYLIREKRPGLRLAALFLFLTMLRSLSKTTILAFLAAQVVLLVRDRSLTRRTKLLLISGGLIVVTAFSGLLLSYVEVYLNRGNESVTLTGRVTIWAYILEEAIQQPWIGHGFHSVWKVIPPLNGGFEARHAHNELLQQFYAYGIAGVAVLVGTYAAFFRKITRVADQRLRLFLFSLLLFVVIRGLTDTEVFDLSLPLWSILLWSDVAGKFSETATASDQRVPRLALHVEQLSPECNF